MEINDKGEITIKDNAVVNAVDNPDAKPDAIS
jgi:hypothetical protein